MTCVNDRKITNFFASSPKDAPLPIHWTTRAEPPKKCAKRGPGRPRKIKLRSRMIERLPTFLQALPRMHPYQYVGQQGLNHPRSVLREALVDLGRLN